MGDASIAFFPINLLFFWVVDGKQWPWHPPHCAGIPSPPMAVHVGVTGATRGTWKNTAALRCRPVAFLRRNWRENR
jgi:hypothetical protein